MEGTSVLEVQDLKTYFFTRTGVVKAVDGVSFSLRAGETLGIVGESGCGKSMMALSIMGMVPQPAGRIVGGRVLLEGENLVTKSPAEMQLIRGRKICMILQDPNTSLNPVYTIGNQLMETLRMHREGRVPGLRTRAVELLRRVRIPSPEERLSSFPHQISGGMRQRVVGAIAISRAPRVLIADEATTSLDTTTQYRYLRMLKRVQRDTGLSLIVITHDFGVLANMCDRVAVMYAGKIVEMASARDLFDHPSHAYTQALIRSVPNLDDDVDYLYSIEGQPPTLDRLPPGCSFAPRCPCALERCHKEYPPPTKISPTHYAACWRPR